MIHEWVLAMLVVASGENCTLLANTQGEADLCF